MTNIEIVLGSGNYIVAGAGNENVEGIQIRLLENHRQEIGTNADDMVDKAAVLCTILFSSLQTARMFQDQINMVCLRMNGYEVHNIH